MNDKKKKDAKQELSKPQEAAQALTLEQVMAHPVVQALNRKVEEMRQLVQGLPEAIGRAVAEAQRAGRPRVVSGPPVALRPDNANVEFHRKGKIIQDGKEVAPEGPTQRDFVKDLGEMRGQGGSPLPALPAPAAKPPAQPPVDPPAEE
jgi:hypothetical protein